MAGLMKKMMDSNYAPGWFFLDRQKGVNNKDIVDKIKIELQNHAINNNYHLDMWTDSFTEEVAMMYYNHFSKLYDMSVENNAKIEALNNPSLATA